MKAAIFIGLIFTTASVTRLYAQEPEPSGQDREQEIIEDVVSGSDEDFEYDTYLETLAFYQQHPLNVNKASREELASLQLLSDDQVNALINYRDKYGDLASIYELNLVPLLDLETITTILPYIDVSDASSFADYSLKNAFKYGRQQVFLRYQRVLEERKGYTEADSNGGARYVGDPGRIYARYKFNFARKMEFGITAEKDPGEDFFSGVNKKGFDFYSGHLFLRDLGPAKAVALGDYSVSLGQGLTVYNGFGYGKSPYVMDVKKEGYSLKPFSSVNEARFMRGAATTLGFGNFELTLFASHKKQDANITVYDSIAGEILEVSSLQETGYHRTPSEIADQDAIRETIVGGAFHFDKDKIKIGVNAAHVALSSPYVRKPEPYNYFQFTGDHITNVSADYAYLFNRLYFFGETAVSDNGGLATLNSLMLRLDDRTSLVLVHRHYQKEYQSLLANPFGESSSLGGETGIYLGMQTGLSAKIQLRAYADLYKFPWLRFASDAPSRGQEYLVQADYRPSYYTEMYIRGKYENKEINLAGNDGNIDELTNTEKWSLRYHLSQRVSKQVSLKSRVEISRYRPSPDADYEKGFLLYQDIVYSFNKWPLKLYARYALFDVSDYDARIYAYESDVLYAFSVPAFSGRGSRAYLMARIDFGRAMDLWLRFAQTYYADREVIGSGLEEIQGATKSEIKVQVRWKF